MKKLHRNVSKNNKMWTKVKQNQALNSVAKKAFELLPFFVTFDVFKAFVKQNKVFIFKQKVTFDVDFFPSFTT